MMKLLDLGPYAVEHVVICLLHGMARQMDWSRRNLEAATCGYLGGDEDSWSRLRFLDWSWQPYGLGSDAAICCQLVSPAAYVFISAKSGISSLHGLTPWTMSDARLARDWAKAAKSSAVRAIFAALVPSWDRAGNVGDSGIGCYYIKDK